MLELFETYEIPATWAVVGHLMLESCDGRHADHPAPDEWFERERTTWRDREDLRFCPDLVTDLLESDVDHEFASHSFSHVLFDRPETDAEIAAAELERSVEIAADWGSRSTRSSIRETASATGTCWRSTAYVRIVAGRQPATACGIARFDDPRPVHAGRADDRRVRAGRRSGVVVPVRVRGPARTVAESIWRDPMVVQVRRGIDEAVRRDGVFHMWLHPNNLVGKQDDRRMRAILEYLDRRRSETDLRVETMNRVAQRTVDGNATTASDANGGVISVSQPAPASRSND